MTKKAPVRSSQARGEAPKLQYLRDTESGAKAHAMASQARHEFVAQQELCASRNVVQDAGATLLRADGESESVSRNETCASRIAVPGRQRGLGGKSGGFRSKSRSKYRVIPHNPAYSRIFPHFGKIGISGKIIPHEPFLIEL